MGRVADHLSFLPHQQALVLRDRPYWCHYKLLRFYPSFTLSASAQARTGSDGRRWKNFLWGEGRVGRLQGADRLFSVFGVDRTQARGRGSVGGIAAS
jgi:hypothetical protein